MIIAVFRLKLPALDFIAASKFSCYVTLLDYYHDDYDNTSDDGDNDIDGDGDDDCDCDCDDDYQTFPPGTVGHRWCLTER